MRYHSRHAVRFGLAVSCLLPGVVMAQDGASAATRRAIESVNARFVRAYNAGDVSTFAQVYAPDATLLPANSSLISGQPAIAGFWQGGWKMGIRNLRLTTTELDAQGGMASEVGRYEFDVQAGSGPVGHDHGKYIVLWKRNRKGEWQWYRDIYNSDVPVPAAPATSAATMGDSVWVVTYKIRPDKRAQYEGFVTRFWKTGLDYGTRQDARVLAAFKKTRVLYPNRTNDDSTSTYMFIMDPVVPGAEYDIQKLLRLMLPPAQAAEEYRLYLESLATGTTNAHQIWSMNQR